jgi:hypothetical protein
MPRHFVTAAAMPITPFLKGEKFDSETTRVMGVALEIRPVADLAASRHYTRGRRGIVRYRFSAPP